MFFSALIYGFLSPLIAARRLYFLSAASVHLALLAVVLAIPLSRIVMNEYLWSIFIGLLLIYTVGYVIHRGIDPDMATAVFVSFSASLTVIAMYFILMNYQLEVNLWSLILGDPLLVSWEDIGYISIVAIITSVAVILTYKEQVYIGVEKDKAILSGINVKLYDWLVYTLLGIATIALIKIIGFVLEHVLILLPSTISMLIARNSRDALIISITVSFISNLTGLYIAVLVNQAPSGVIGLILFTIYLLALLKVKV